MDTLKEKVLYLQIVFLVDSTYYEGLQKSILKFKKYNSLKNCNAYNTVTPLSIVRLEK